MQKRIDHSLESEIPIPTEEWKLVGRFVDIEDVPMRDCKVAAFQIEGFASFLVFITFRPRKWIRFIPGTCCHCETT